MMISYVPGPCAWPKISPTGARPTRWLRPLLLLTAALGLATGGCSRVKTGLLLTIETTAQVQRLAVESRTYVNTDVLAGDAGEVRKLEFVDLDGVGLEVGKTKTVLLQPDGAFKAGQVFLLHITGAPARVGTSVLVAFAEGEIRALNLLLVGNFTACDKDGDGFPGCGSGCSEYIDGCDCNDQKGEVNPFYPEVCDSQDNDCRGFLDSLITCSTECIFDQPCGYSALKNASERLGVGVCAPLYQECLANGTLGPECPALPEGYVEQETTEHCDGLDNDCNGTVDRGCPCSGTETRACLRGRIGTRAQPLRPGVCAVGEQTCSDGVWGKCVGAGAPAAGTVTEFQREKEADCDGLDNNCDGFIDSEPYFDSDSDGFTWCGACTANARTTTVWAETCGQVAGAQNPEDPAFDTVAKRAGQTLFAELIDCEDRDARIKPPLANFADAHETCEVDADPALPPVDENCLCDHADDAARRATPSLAVGRTNACESPSDAYLSCADIRPGRLDPTPGGICGDTGGPSEPGDSPNSVVYYFGYGIDNDGTTQCFACGDPYGRTCAVDGRCSLKADDCGGDCLSRGLPLSPRPACRQPGGGCSGSTAPSWVPVDAGTDVAGDCSPLACANRFVLVGSETVAPVCHVAAPGNGDCNGGGGCQTPAEECVEPGTALTNRPICQKPSGGCSGTAGPLYDVVPVGTDPYSDCPSSGVYDSVCQLGATAGTGVCEGLPGDSCSIELNCAGDLSCVDGICCKNPSCGACQMCGAGGECLPRDGPEGRGGCTGPCTRCSGGSCVNSSNGPSTETTGPCGVGGCVGPQTVCSNGVASCASSGRVCPVGCTTVDTKQNGLCNLLGTACEGTGGGTEECEACEACSGVGVCSSSGATQDLTGTNVCLSSNIDVCTGGVCLFDDGKGCGATNALCASGFCRDGVCCNNTCGDSCRTCDGAMSTAAAGTCGNFDASCGTGLCSGSYGCVNNGGTETVTCDGASNTCDTCDGDLLVPGSCATLTCASGASQNCPNNVKCTGNGGCPGCAGDNSNCLPDHYCDGSTCVAEKAAGVACGGGGECTSGNCVDGVCCASPACGLCQRCDRLNSGSVAPAGSCRQVAAGSDIDSDCTAYLCDAGSCTENCSDHSDCNEAYYCNGSICAVDAALGAACASAAQCGPLHRCRASDMRCRVLVVAGDDCSAPGDCARGLLCNIMSKCEASAGVCTAAGDRNCPENQWCNAGSCNGDLSLGAVCDRDEQCAAGWCTIGPTKVCVGDSGGGGGCSRHTQCTSGVCGSTGVCN